MDSNGSKVDLNDVLDQKSVVDDAKSRDMVSGSDDIPNQPKLGEDPYWIIISMKDKDFELTSLIRHIMVGKKVNI